MARPLAHSAPDRAAPARFWCQWALLDGALQPQVTVDVDGDGFISAVAPGTACPTDAVELTGIVIPGAANAHSHCFHRALRGRTHRGGDFWTWRTMMYRAANRLDPERYYRLARGVYGEMLLAGITTVGEFHYVHHRPDGNHYGDPNAMAEALLAAADDVGIRLTLLDALYLYGGLDADGLAPLADEQRRFGDGTVEAWAKRVEWLLNLTTAHRFGVAIHSVRAAAPTDIAAVARFASAHRVPLHIHVSEQPAENEACRRHYGCSPLELLIEQGAGPMTTFVHGTHFDADDLGRLAVLAAEVDGGPWVCFCPTTERDLGDGLGPARDIAAAGVALSLGTDSHADIDPLGEAEALEHHERLRRLERGVFSERELMRAVTNHRSLGWDDVGEIAVGQRADLVARRVDGARLAGTPTEISALIYAGSADDVSDVVVDGEHLVVGSVHHHIDVAAELDAAIGELIDR